MHVCLSHLVSTNNELDDPVIVVASSSDFFLIITIANDLLFQTIDVIPDLSRRN
jgi:hypothetical protein